MVEPNAPTQMAPAPQPAAAPRQGEPCESCGAPLAVDQRYCLNCGQRRGGARVDYRHYMATAAGGEDAPPSQPQAQADAAAPEGSERKERDYAPLAAVGGIAVLGLMLLVGVLIGKGNGNDTAATPAPVVVKGGGEAATTSSPETEAGKGSARKAKGGSASSGGEKKVKGGLTEHANSNATVEASKGELESLEGESGGSYEEKSKKLPNKIATPGKPPPIDKTTPPGGGEGGGEVIK